ncbi:sodium/glutamate symporter [Sporomusa acidovorans]|uniref:Sodium/glutamate symporter n=1 Tax=Sporomusa acidovorans (strain ATCC 49682 / DSM 3132 / Mol) TaxID=1123286 RepID=A0ABZ3J0X0_SPOA4|nr:sodium/glutamate symporter [Sporomusa acidovorans]OZC22827.1 sodium/glutamate symport carrier protein [Sporomusa acidovorans DSM 3132]SDE52178.1 glutamate:Na+ symporter, ESS family [Sporomusa acidovorans]
MNFEVVNQVLVMKLDLVATVAVAVLLLMFGSWLRRVFPVLARFCIPAAVIGGFTFSMLAWVLKETSIVTFKMDTVLQMPFMIAFFTTVGLGGSFGLIKKGGKSLFVYLVGCWVLAVMQNVVGAGMAMLSGIHPVLGVMAGAVSLEGGMGAASAFGPTAEQLGVQGAFVVAVAAATYGLITGGLVGGPLAKWLIEHYNLAIETSKEEFNALHQVSPENEHDDVVSSNNVLSSMAVILVAMVLGAMFSAKIKDLTGFVLPGYVGAMFVAVLIRNFNDVKPVFTMNEKAIDLIADVSLGIFLTMAMMSLKIWELSSLAGPLVLILVVQTIFMFIYCIYFLFPLLGRDYDAAIMCAGMIGHGLGATPNAIANMNAVTERYGVVSRKAFLIVPLCGAVLIDFVGIPNIVWFINYFTK